MLGLALMNIGNLCKASAQYPLPSSFGHAPSPLRHACPREMSPACSGHRHQAGQPAAPTTNQPRPLFPPVKLPVRGRFYTLENWPPLALRLKSAISTIALVASKKASPDPDL
jgi:hypothetical protein